MHDGESEIPVVSYNPNLHSICENAMVTSKVLKLINHKQNYDSFRKENVLTLGEPTSIEYSDRNVPYEKVKLLSQQFNQITLKDIASICVDELINICASVDGSENPVEEITTRFGLKKKKDVNVYDDSCELKLSLWGDHISQIASNGVYMMKDLRVKSYRGKFLTTTASTHIAKTDDKPLENRSMKDQDDQDFEFPADAIPFFQKCYFCQKCGRTAILSTVFVVCSTCGSKSLVKKSKNRFSVKLGFGDASLVFPHELVMEFCALLGMDTSNETGVEELLLSNESVVGKYNPKNNMITKIQSK